MLVNTAVDDHVALETARKNLIEAERVRNEVVAAASAALAESIAGDGNRINEAPSR